MASTRELLGGLERFGIRLGLDHLKDLTAALGSPQLATPSILVAGTNGKGSVSSLIASIAEAAKLETGLYTSPHLESVTERIRIAGAAISEKALGEELTDVLSAAQRLGHASPTYFEALTLAAFRYFAAQRIDLAVLEVGMGGRLDATNLADPGLSVITSIALDHQEWLGSSLQAIAREKAGVLRPSRPAIVAPQVPEARDELTRIAQQIGATWVAVDHQVTNLEIRFRGLAGLELSLTTRDATYDLRSALAGRHQAWNIATAVVAAERFADSGMPAISPEEIAEGVSRCRWPGRLEPMALGGSRTTVLLDAAHNPAGCAALVDFLDELDRPFTLLFGALADKDLAAMLPSLAIRANRVVLSRPLSDRAADPAALLELIPPGIDVVVEPDVAAALTLALAGQPELVVACGSIFLIGALRALISG
ncbi:MAG: folylpolyglutamate synthase/dihydrofolate synthase family protein [Thermoanaerobaculia bacterium]